VEIGGQNQEEEEKVGPNAGEKDSFPGAALLLADGERPILVFFSSSIRVLLPISLLVLSSSRTIPWPIRSPQACVRKPRDRPGIHDTLHTRGGTLPCTFSRSSRPRSWFPGCVLCGSACRVWRGPDVKRTGCGQAALRLGGRLLAPRGAVRTGSGSEGSGAALRGAEGRWGSWRSRPGGRAEPGSSRLPCLSAGTSSKLVSYNAPARCSFAKASKRSQSR